MDLITYAVGDVHGCSGRLADALAWAAADAAEQGCDGLVVLLGDYVDKGPDSRGVVEMLMGGPGDPHMRWLPLRGNHDDIFAQAVLDPTNPMAGNWWEFGGQEALMSYGWNPLKNPIPDDLTVWVPVEHAMFLAGLPTIHEDEDRIFVHAGLRPGVAISDQTEEDLLWIRGDFARSEYDFGKTVVHGHTPVGKEPFVSAGRINLDIGCFMGGSLAVAAFSRGAPPRIEIFSEARPAASNPFQFR